MTAPIWISERDSQLDLKSAIALLRKAMLRQASGRAVNMEKTHVQWANGSMHAIGAVFSDSGLLGVKTWAHTTKGATPIEILWDAETGQLLAVIEAFAMGQLRTAGMAGLATDCLAEIDADLFCICGTGKQAMAQIAAVQAVRPLKTVRVYGRNEERRGKLSARVVAELGLHTEIYESVVQAVRGSPMITLITRAKAAFLTVEMPARGAHINAIGAITPERQEFEPGLLDRCGTIAVDSVEQAKSLASELMSWGQKPSQWSSVVSLSEIVAKGARRPSGADLTLFKSLGVGIADLALAEALYYLARERGTGTELPTPAPIPLSFSRVAGGMHG